MRSASGRPNPEHPGSSSPSSSGTSGSPHAPSSAAPVRDLQSLVRGEMDFVWRQLRRAGFSRADADDATQQVFLVASRRLVEVEPGKVRSFLYGTLLRVAANLRRGQRRRREEPEIEPVLAADGQRPDELLERRRAHLLLDQLLAELPEELRRVLVLADIERLTLAAIAELEDIPAGTAASRLRRARAAFRRLLEQRQREPSLDSASPGGDDE